MARESSGPTKDPGGNAAGSTMVKDSFVLGEEQSRPATGRVGGPPESSSANAEMAGKRVNECKFFELGAANGK